MPKKSVEYEGPFHLTCSELVPLLPNRQESVCGYTKTTRKSPTKSQKKSSPLPGCYRKPLDAQSVYGISFDITAASSLVKPDTGSCEVNGMT